MNVMYKIWGLDFGDTKLVPSIKYIISNVFSTIKKNPFLNIMFNFYLINL